VTSQSDALVTRFLHALHEREVSEDDPASLEYFEQTFRQLTSYAKTSDRVEQDAILQRLVAGMTKEQSSWEFGCLANTCGIIVENGGDSAIAVEPILDRITEQFKRVPSFVVVMQAELGIEHPHRVAEEDWAKLGTAHPEHAWVIGEWFALQFMGCAAMAMLSRDAELRRKARERAELMQSIETARGDNPYAYYLAELLA
jgi:hypothetical protein